MAKIIFTGIFIFLLLFLNGYFGEKSEHSINQEIHEKCRGGSMEFLDTFECVNLVIDKTKIVAETDFNEKKDDIKNCIGENNVNNLIIINEKTMESLEKSRPSTWSHYVPFISPKNSFMSRLAEISKSDEMINNEKKREALINGLQKSERECLLNKDIKSLAFIRR